LQLRIDRPKICPLDQVEVQEVYLVVLNRLNLECPVEKHTYLDMFLDNIQFCHKYHILFLVEISQLV
jgi:hypothetical protein